MFTAKTERIKKLTQLFPKVMSELEVILGKSANIYIDWQNVIHWQDKLGWHLHLKSIKKIREFICWPREIPADIKKKLDAL